MFYSVVTLANTHRLFYTADFVLMFIRFFAEKLDIRLKIIHAFFYTTKFFCIGDFNSIHLSFYMFLSHSYSTEDLSMLVECSTMLVEFLTVLAEYSSMFIEFLTVLAEYSCMFIEFLTVLAEYSCMFIEFFAMFVKFFAILVLFRHNFLKHTDYFMFHLHHNHLPKM